MTGGGHRFLHPLLPIVGPVETAVIKALDGPFFDDGLALEKRKPLLLRLNANGPFLLGHRLTDIIANPASLNRAIGADPPRIETSTGRYLSGIGVDGDRQTTRRLGVRKSPYSELQKVDDSREFSQLVKSYQKVSRVMRWKAWANLSRGGASIDIAYQS